MLGYDQIQQAWTKVDGGQLQQAAITLALATGIVLIIRYFWKKRTIRARISRKQQQCRTAIKALEDYINKEGLPRKRQEQILSLNFSQLQDQLQKGQLSAVEVLKAYQAKALQVNEYLNFIVEPVQEALSYAEKLDREPKKRPLHGIPVSLKENYYIKGYDSTGGQSLFLNKPAKQHGALVNVLLELGCVPFVRTNIPQCMMTFECSNPIYGTTHNPHNLKRGPGGSSGGEGCILGAEASILGWGSDIGGSLRIPSQFCGVCCLKPTFGRLGSSTTEELVYGQKLIQPTCGPMARDVDTLVTVMKNILCPRLFEQEPEMPPMLFNTQLYESKKSLRIGCYETDGGIPPIPGVKRGLDEAKLALESMGHTIVPFNVPDVDYMFGVLFCQAAFADGGQEFLGQLAEDEIDSSIQLIIRTYQLPHFMLRALSRLLDCFTGEVLPGMIMRNMLGVKSVREYWKLAVEMDNYKAKFHALWQASKLDAVICPTFPYVAPPTGCVKYVLGGATYSSLYNLLNYPAGCVPVTKVTAIDQKEMKDYPAKTQTQKFIKKYYSSDTGGLPVTVQCVALPYQEELCLRVMKDLETGLSKEGLLRVTKDLQTGLSQEGPSHNLRSRRT